MSKERRVQDLYTKQISSCSTCSTLEHLELSPRSTCSTLEHLEHASHVTYLLACQVVRAVCMLRWLTHPWYWPTIRQLVTLGLSSKIFVSKVWKMPPIKSNNRTFSQRKQFLISNFGILSLSMRPCKSCSSAEAAGAPRRRRRKPDTEGVGHCELSKREGITKHPSLHHSLWCSVEAIPTSEPRLKPFCYRSSCNWFEWKSRSACWQFVKFCRDSHVFFEVEYPFNFTRYRWFCRRKIRSTSYLEFSCDW